MSENQGKPLKKFTVIKNEDVNSYLNSFDQKELVRLMEKIQRGRKMDEKDLDHAYIVVNLDEPYVPEIIEIMKKNNHWG